MDVLNRLPHQSSRRVVTILRRYSATAAAAAAVMAKPTGVAAPDRKPGSDGDGKAGPSAAGTFRDTGTARETNCLAIGPDADRGADADPRRPKAGGVTEPAPAELEPTDAAPVTAPLALCCSPSDGAAGAAVPLEKATKSPPTDVEPPVPLVPEAESGPVLLRRRRRR